MRRFAELNGGKRSAALSALVVLTWAVISAGPAWGGSLYKADSVTALNVTNSWLTTAVGRRVEIFSPRRDGIAIPSLPR